MAAGQRAAAERQALNLTQEEIARRVSRLGYQISQTGIDKMEKRDTMRPKFAKELAEALGITEQWLLTGREPKHHDSDTRMDTIIRDARRLSADEQQNVYAQFRALLAVALQRDRDKIR